MPNRQEHERTFLVRFWPNWSHMYDFLTQMELGRQNAKKSRDNGGSAVQVFATAKTMYDHQGLDKAEQAVLQAVIAMRKAAIDAMEALKAEANAAA